MNNINPAFMNEIFELWKTNRAVRNQYKLNLEVPIINQVTLEPKVLDILNQNLEFTSISKKVKLKSYNFNYKKL